MKLLDMFICLTIPDYTKRECIKRMVSEDLMLRVSAGINGYAVYSLQRHLNEITYF